MEIACSQDQKLKQTVFH